MEENSNYLENFSPLNARIPKGMIPFTESLKIHMKEWFLFMKMKLNKNLKNGKNILISAHGNSSESFM